MEQTGHKCGLKLDDSHTQYDYGLIVPHGNTRPLCLTLSEWGTGANSQIAHIFVTEAPKCNVTERF